MASIIAVRELAASLGVSILDNQIESIARQCGDFDAEKVSVALKIIEPDKLNARTILAAIRKHQHAKKAEYCGLCREGWIPVLDWWQWKEAGQPDLSLRKVFIPKMDSPCPTCQPNRHPSLSERLAKMTETERGWTFCILYDFYVYSLENTATMGDFDPHRLWGVFRDEPHLTGSMMEFMAWVEKGIEAREPTEEGKEKVHQLLYGTARARAFG
jgi:hypothetical protein